MDSNYRLDRLGVHIFFKCLLSDVCRFLQRHTSFLMLLPLLKPKKLHLSQFDISNIFQLRYCCTQVTQLREYLEVHSSTKWCVGTTEPANCFVCSKTQQSTNNWQIVWTILHCRTKQFSNLFLKAHNRTSSPWPPYYFIFWLWEQGNLGILAPGRYFSWLYECCVICAIEQEKDEMV